MRRNVSLVVFLGVEYILMFLIVFATTRVDKWDDSLHLYDGVEKQYSNLLGQHLPTVRIHYIIAFSVAGIARAVMVRQSGTRYAAIKYYGIVILALLPCIWLFVANDWNKAAASDVACWLGSPIGLFAVPTAVLVIFWATMRHLTLPCLFIELIFELAVTVIIWEQIWPFIEFAILGWCWI